MVNLKNRYNDQTKRYIKRGLRMEICLVYKVNFHHARGDKKFNTVDVIMRDRAKRVPTGDSHIRRRIPVLPSYVGGHCQGTIRPLREGDLVYVWFYNEKQGLVIGPAWNWGEYPVCRECQYDIVDKGGQWMKPQQDPKTWDFIKQPYPEVKKPYCFKWFHGPITGTTGKGRDWAWMLDYCHMGDSEPECQNCKDIDSICRSLNHFFKFYSSETESKKAHPDRGEYHAPCGSYWMFDSKCCTDCEHCAERCCSEVFTKGKGYWRIQGATSEQARKGHITHDPTGSVDIHSATSDPADNTGVRCKVVSPDDGTEDFAFEVMDFITGAYIRILKSGEIKLHSPGKITLDAPLVQETANNQVSGSCSHGSCSCSSAASTHVDLDTGRVMKQEGNNQVPVGSLTCAKIACYNSGKMACCTGGCDLYELVEEVWTFCRAGVTDLCYSLDGVLYILDAPSTSMYRREADKSWTALGGLCLSVAATSSTLAYVVGADFRLWKNDNGTWTNIEVSTPIIDISVAKDGSVYAIRQPDKALLRFNGSDYDVVSTALALKEISARDTYHIYGLGDSDDIVYLWNDVRWTSQGMTAASIGLSSVA